MVFTVLAIEVDYPDNYSTAGIFKWFYMSSNLQTINTIYEAFGKGNIPAIIDCIADNSEWELWADNSAMQSIIAGIFPLPNAS